MLPERVLLLLMLRVELLSMLWVGVPMLREDEPLIPRNDEPLILRDGASMLRELLPAKESLLRVEFLTEPVAWRELLRVKEFPLDEEGLELVVA